MFLIVGEFNWLDGCVLFVTGSMMKRVKILCLKSSQKIVFALSVVQSKIFLKRKSKMVRKQEKRFQEAEKRLKVKEMQQEMHRLF